jgi:flagellar motor switch/type III secretory pathway protein FliN
LCRAAPSGNTWHSWLVDVFGRLLEKPTGQQVRLVQTHIVDAQFGEKTLGFGSKLEVLLGRQAENDVVLAASAIASRHARLFLNEGHLYLEDLGGQLGTYLWDARIPSRQKLEVRTGDQFTVFPYRFRIHLEQRWGPVGDVSLTNWTLQLVRRADFLATTAPDSTSFLLDAHPGGESILAGVNSAFLEGLRQRILEPLRLPTVGQPVASDDACLGFILFAILERLNRRLESPLQFSFARDGRKTTADATRGMLLSFAICVDQLAGHFRVFLPLGLISGSTRSPAAEVNLSRFGKVGWRFPVTAGSVDLSVEELSQLGLGDIVVAQLAPAILFPKDSSRGWSIIAEGSNFERFRIDKCFEGGPTVPNLSEANASGGKLRIEDLPLRLHVVLAEKEFTLAEIQSFSSGTIVELGINKLAPVQLMVNGTILGEGELVEVEGSLAVRVLGWRNS